MHAVLLDFNGTMFFDTRFHVIAWSEIYHELHPEDTNPLDQSLICGPCNEAILKNFAPWLTDEECRQYSERKEEWYRQVCRRNPDSLHLVAGAEQFMQTLRQKGIPFALASASIQSNIDFYFDTFHLGRWFNKEDVVFDNGTYANKGEMHLEAARRLQVPFSQTLVVEDSKFAISLASQNGAGRIVAIGEQECGGELLQVGAAHYIRSFNEFDYNWLND